MRKDFPESPLEALCWRSNWLDLPLFLTFACYRPPNACKYTFRQLEESMQDLDREKREIILLMDTNFDTFF